MAIFDKIKSKKKKTSITPVSIGRVSEIPRDKLNISASYRSSDKILEELQSTSDAVKQIEIIVSKTPDGQAALNIYQRLANQGIDIEWFDATTGELTKSYDAEVREFASRAIKNSTTGIDGLIDMIIYGLVVQGGSAVEIVVTEDAKDIDEIVVVDVSTFDSFEWDDKLGRYRIYQKSNQSKKRDLYSGNFFYTPNDPKPSSPKGTLHFEGAIYAMTHYLSLMKDAGEVLKRIGYPRYNFTIKATELIESLPDVIKNNPEELSKALDKEFNNIQSQVSGMNSNSDFIGFDYVTRETIGGNSSIGVDIRSFIEILNYEIPQAFKIPPIIMGRGQGGGSYALGTVEMKVLIDKIESMRRVTKRMLENIMNFWARVKGYNITCKVNHKPIDWQKELDIVQTKLRWLEYYRRMQEYEYITAHEAAQKVAGKEFAVGDTKGKYAYLTKELGVEEEKSEEGEGENEYDKQLER